MPSTFQGLTDYANNAAGFDKNWSNALKIPHDYVEVFTKHECQQFSVNEINYHINSKWSLLLHVMYDNKLDI